MNTGLALWDDVALATRLLRKSSVFTAAVVLTLALGVGVNTVIFSVVNAVILRPLPARGADRLAVIASQDTASRRLGAISLPDLQDYRAATSDVLEDIAGYSAGWLHALARLRRGVTLERAQAAISVEAERLARQYHDSNTNVAVRVLPERLARPEEDQYRTNALGGAIVLALAILVMIVAAVNMTDLLLARAVSRRQELAIRVALGAGRGRIMRQMLTDSLMLAALGGAAGVVLGTWAARVLATMRLPGDLPVRFDFQLDGRVLTYALTVALVTGVLAGLVPAVRVTGAGLDDTLRQSRHGSPRIQDRRISGFVVVAQIALCFLLLTAAGLFARSLFEAERADLGFRAEGVINLHMDVGQLGYTEPQGRSFFDEVERRIRLIPGVQNVSFAFTVPIWCFPTGPADTPGRCANPGRRRLGYVRHTRVARHSRRSDGRPPFRVKPESIGLTMG